MASSRQYSTLFSCLHDEPEPIGHIGRGCHYSVFRSVEWLDIMRKPLGSPQVHDFAVIWDEDHDTRIIAATEQIYMAGLLSPIQFIGERKGQLSVIVAAKFFFDGDGSALDNYRDAIGRISTNLDFDSWPSEVGTFDRQPGSPHQTDTAGIISDDDWKVQTYLRNIDNLWQLGTRYYNQKQDTLMSGLFQPAQRTFPLNFSDALPNDG